MNLTFDSIAVFEEKTDSVKFANRFIDPTGVERLAISRVSREFLMALCDRTDASAEDLLEAYVSKCYEVNDIAARQFAAGEQTPFLGLARAWPRWQAELEKEEIAPGAG